VKAVAWPLLFLCLIAPFNVHSQTKLPLCTNTATKDNCYTLSKQTDGREVVWYQEWKNDQRSLFVAILRNGVIQAFQKYENGKIDGLVPTYSNDGETPLFFLRYRNGQLIESIRADKIEPYIGEINAERDSIKYRININLNNNFEYLAFAYPEKNVNKFQDQKSSSDEVSVKPVSPNKLFTIGNGKRYALVIGNSDYKSVPKLPNSVNDANEIAKALQATGFNVSKYENIDLRMMQDVIRNFGSKLGRNDVGLFYFAGHGVQVKGKNYLIPVGENIKKSFEVPSSAIDADLVLATMEDAKNNLNIVILDACRSPFPGEGRSVGRGLATLDAAKGTLIAYATAPGKEALDGQGTNSPYTKNLVKALQQKGLSIEQVFKLVRIGVVEETKGAQVPWENSSIMGDFYFYK